jgi:ankyrin repeat domain-containing protein 50
LSPQKQPSYRYCILLFQLRGNSKKSVSGLLRALLLQLSNRLDNKHAALTQLHTSCKDYEPAVPALESTLKQVVTKFQDVYVVIDALDESPKGEQRDAVLDTLSEMYGWSISGFHLFVTSRDELDIRIRFSLQTDQKVSMDNNGVDGDIEHYVLHRLRHDRKFQKFALHYSEIEETLIERAHGV